MMELFRGWKCSEEKCIWDNCMDITSFSLLSPHPHLHPVPSPPTHPHVAIFQHLMTEKGPEGGIYCSYLALVLHDNKEKNTSGITQTRIT